jgi:4a-hydroxytetrahydrobiopterin dehydratase
MAERTALAPAEPHLALQSLQGWSPVSGKLYRDFPFENFTQAFGFMTRVALLAERLNHHPEWFNVHGKVVINLITRDAGGISLPDVEFTRTVNAFSS